MVLDLRQTEKEAVPALTWQTIYKQEKNDQKNPLLEAVSPSLGGNELEKGRDAQLARNCTDLTE